ncbi:hypothetical protein M8J75_007024 [Diaphorina citri]|nr:hypothetical protein M8J75_007024 [Diaphorina citri]
MSTTGPSPLPVLSMVLVTLLMLMVFNHNDVLGFQFELGFCPRPKLMNHFNLTKYLGTWHQQKFMTNLPLLSSIGKCPKQTLAYKYNFVVKGFGKAVPEEVGKLIVNLRLPVLGWRQAPLWILSTDYTNYAIAWSCMDFRGLFNIQTGFVLSRGANKTEDFDNTVNTHLIELGLSPATFVQLDQFECE